MPRKGKSFELEYKWLYELNSDKYKISSPGYVIDKVTGRQRELDVLIEYYDEEGNLRKMSIECRDRKQKQDVTWIEQLKTKKEDCELDYVIATTKTTFNKNAIIKARQHGIIIERAEAFNSKTVLNISNQFLIDMFFLKFELNKLTFFIDNKVIQYADLIKKIPFYLIEELNKEINTELYFNIEPNEVLNQEKFDKKTFFENTENSFLTYRGDNIFGDNCSDIIKKLNIQAVRYEIKLNPFRVSLPLNKSMSVFEVENIKNKKYKAYFGNDEEYIIYGYLSDNKIYTKAQLKERKYYRLVSMDMHFNTIFPNIEENMTFDTNEIVEKGCGEFDFSKIIK